ncbi:MAG: hypothetical protein HQ548_01900 [Chloroflexi bacterium]|nr:hypothetical protein [Chloroflexota bacterium]
MVVDTADAPAWGTSIVDAPTQDQPVQPVGPSAAGLAILRAEFVSGEMT